MNIDVKIYSAGKEPLKNLRYKHRQLRKTERKLKKEVLFGSEHHIKPHLSTVLGLYFGKCLLFYPD